MSVYTKFVRLHLNKILAPTSNRPNPSVRRCTLFSNPLAQAASSPNSHDRRLRMSSLILKLAFGRNFNASSRLVKENKNLRDDVMSSKLAHTVRIERWNMSAP